MKNLSANQDFIIKKRWYLLEANSIISDTVYYTPVHIDPSSKISEQFSLLINTAYENKILTKIEKNYLLIQNTCRSIIFPNTSLTPQKTDNSRN